MILFSKIEGKGNPQPFLILHGFLGMSDNWKTLGTEFAAANLEVHLLDLRNHGRSFQSDVFNYEVMAQDVVAYCDFNNLKNIYLLGHSMGGKVAMEVATTHPDLVSKLIIADIGPKEYQPHHQEILEGLKNIDFSSNPSRTEIDDTLAKSIPDFGTRQFLLKSLYRKTKDQLEFRFNLDSFLGQPKAIGQPLALNKMYTKPVLFLKGEKSNYILSEDSTLIEKHFPQSKIETINNAGHWLHAENPEQFYEKAMAFLKI